MINYFDYLLNIDTYFTTLDDTLKEKLSNNIVNLNQLNMYIDIYKTNYCIAAYNKKQEFTGGKIEVNKINCTDFSEEIFLDNFSIYEAKHKNLKNLI